MKSIALLLIVLLLPAYAQVRPHRTPADRNATLSQRSFDIAGHTIRPGDKLFVSVWRQPHLSTRIVVGDDGKVELPHAGSVSVEGLTTAKLAELYTMRLKSRLASPKVVVSFMELAGSPRPGCTHLEVEDR